MTIIIKTGAERIGQKNNNRAVVVAAIIAVAVSVYDKKGEYDYSLTGTNSFNHTFAGSNLTKTADAGNVFVIATITLKNTDYSPGIDTNPWYFKMNVNGASYRHDLASYSHPGHKDTVTLGKGSQYTFTVVFQAPSGTTGATLVWDGIRIMCHTTAVLHDLVRTVGNKAHHTEVLRF